MDDHVSPPGHLGEDCRMGNSHPELSSLATALGELTDRMASIAGSLEGAEHNWAIELYEVERTLNSARRRLEKLLVDKSSWNSG